MMRFCMLGGVVVIVLLAVGCEQSPAPPAAAPAGTATQPASAPSSDRVTLDDVKRKARDTADAAGEAIRQAREKYQQDAERELARLDERVKDLRQKVDQAAEDAKPELERRLKEAADKAQAARQQFDRLKQASGDAWKEFKKGLEGAVGELKKAVGEAPASQPAAAPVASQPQP